MYNLRKDYNPQKVQAVAEVYELGEIVTIDMDVMLVACRHHGKMAITEFTNIGVVKKAVSTLHGRFLWWNAEETIV